MVTGKVPYDGETPNEVMRKHVHKNIDFTPADHLNTTLSSGVGEVIETMMAKNRENRYRTPDDLILDLKCLIQGEPPIIAAQKSNALDTLAEGEFAEDDGEAVLSATAAADLEEMAGYVNSRNFVIAALGVILAVSIVANVVFLAMR